MPAAALANPGPTLNFGQELNAAACGGGTLVINVKQDVVNSIDSGFGGNNWAYDNYTRQIKVWRTGPNTYCGTVQEEGRFTTVAGTSPNQSGTVSDGITGQFQGGYRMTPFTATLRTVPDVATRGNIGTIDYQCDAATGNCPGAISWPSLFFSGLSGNELDQLDWWGWVYHGGSNGTWVNASSGSGGDITG